MVRIITQKCPCGYTYKEKRHIVNQVVSPLIIQDPIYGYAGLGMPNKEKIIEKTVLEGDEEFIKFPVLTQYYYRYDTLFGVKESTSLLVCPKCGTVLYPKIAMEVEESSDK